MTGIGNFCTALVRTQDRLDRPPCFQQNGNMKTTIELPDPLMTEVKILAAREQRKLGELMAELVRAGLEGRMRGGEAAQPDSAEEWLAAWLKLADELMQDAPAGPAARALLDEERNRLERG